MSVADIKAHIHELVDRSDDEQLLKDVEQRLTQPAEPDILDELTPAQLAGLMQAREDVKAGNYITLQQHKEHLDQWVRSRQ
jgi:hypothetical protein